MSKYHFTSGFLTLPSTSTSALVSSCRSPPAVVTTSFASLSRFSGFAQATRAPRARKLSSPAPKLTLRSSAPARTPSSPGPAWKTRAVLKPATGALGITT